MWERCKAEEKKLAGLLSVSEEEAMEDLTAVAPAMVALLELTEDFAERYRQEKLRLNAADFSDQEHLALGLLVGSGGAPTELGEQVAARYREILVDEYQDTNEIQNAIFRAVSKNGQNIFTVGDVKQSIYRFRLADPTIFLGKYNRFKSWQEAADGEERKILLSRNFRSRREILESTNFIFSNILSVEMGEMDYGEDEALHFGAAYYPERMDCQTEFHLISAHQKAGENDKPVKKVTAEARFVAARIRQLLEESTGRLREQQHRLARLPLPRSMNNDIPDADELETVTSTGKVSVTAVSPDDQVMLSVSATSDRDTVYSLPGTVQFTVTVTNEGANEVKDV